jgi:hypothetical protein
MRGSVAQRTYEEGPRAVSRACRAVRRFRRAWCRCWAVGERAGCAYVSGAPRLGAGAKARPAAVRAAYGLPFAHGQLSRGVGTRAWPLLSMRSIVVSLSVLLVEECTSFGRDTV